MHDELSARQAAIRLRLAGENIEAICQTLNRSESWFHKWWRRYMDVGPAGLYDLTRAPRQVTNRTPPHIERAIISIRKRLTKRATAETRYGLVGAEQIRAELENLGYTPLPSARTIERIVNQAGLSCPPLQLAPRIARTEYPGPQAQDSNQVHQVDFVGPRYLKDDKTRYYFLVCRDIFDQAVYIEFVTNRTSDTVLEFLVHAWMKLGIPAIVQFDNGKEFTGWGTAARSLSRVIRLALRLQVEVSFIPEGKPCYNGSVEQFNGWFQPLLLERTYRRPFDVRRQVSRLILTVNEQHVHAHLGHQTTVAYRRSKQLRKLPADCRLHLEKHPISVGKVSFIRLVKSNGTVNILSQQFKVGRRLKFQYIKASLFTKMRVLKIYHKGRLVKQFKYELLDK
ncbi:DDE-type integrase/transposase/recombinase [Chloroflexi bacterium TSY]|nr:DDE-type integrase/transposase/recombinase [Chloroflexi bacterium TSY]